MSETGYEEIEKRISQANTFIYNKIIAPMPTNEGMCYALTRFTQDFLRMTYHHVSKNMPPQEAKATMKVILDTVLLNYGMHVRIDEFDKPS